MAGTGETTAHRIGFLLVPGFALMSYASATEPYRAANILAGRTLFELVSLAEKPGAVAASSGATVEAGGLAPRDARLDAVFVCAGGSPAQWQIPAIHTALRQFASEGVRIGGISGGPYLLAAAGLLRDRRFTIHWEHAAAFREAFPDLEPEQARFVIDRDRLTCGGGVAPLDMMHALIAERLGADFARRVSDWYLHTEVGAPGGPQRASLAARHRVHHPALLMILEKMEATIEAPLSHSAMARLAGLSTRQVDRLFARHMGSRFSVEYRRIRLEHAERLLRESSLRVAEIAFATGFSSAGHFSREFARIHGLPPTRVRLNPNG